MSRKTIVEQLVTRREHAGITQQEIASRMGTSQPVIARFEAGNRDPRLSTLERYARVVGAEIELAPSGAVASTPTAANLANRIHDRLVSTPEPPTATFREVIQFLDDLEHATGAELKDAVQVEPLSAGDRRWDALIAATVDWLARARGVAPPRWTGSSRCRLPDPGWVLTPYERQRELVRASTPPEFAAHGVYLDASSLMSV